MSYNPKEALMGLGFTNEHVNSIMEGLVAPDGLFLVSGISGSRKGTTLRELVKIATATPSVRKISAANLLAFDSKEYAESSTTNFSVIPEIRSSVMVAACAEITKNGERVIGKINASCAFSAPIRLNCYKRELPGDLHKIKFSGVIHQVSLPSLCVNCSTGYDKESDNLDEHVQHLIASRVKKTELKSLRFRSVDGCTNCCKGVTGFTLVAEVVIPDDEMNDLFNNGLFTDAIVKFTAGGGKLILDHAMEKACQGLVDINDVARKLGVD